MRLLTDTTSEAVVSFIVAADFLALTASVSQQLKLRAPPLAEIALDLTFA